MIEERFFTEADLIKVDERYVLYFELHPDNGFECTTHAQNDSGSESWYKFTHTDLKNAESVKDGWIVNGTCCGEKTKAKIQFFKTTLFGCE